MNKKGIISIAGSFLAVASLVVMQMFVFSCISTGKKVSDSDLANHKPYSRVCVFGVDGAGGFFGKYESPEFHEIFDKGAVNYKVMTQNKCESCPNWFSILHGVNYLKHGIDRNEKADIAHEKFEKYPSFIKEYLNNNASKEAYSIVNYGTINDCLLEDDSRLTKINVSGAGSVDIDENVKNQVIETISTKDVGIMFMHFDQVDHFGHEFGNKSNEYKAAIKTVSGYIGEIYNKYVELGYGEDTLFVAVSDHGMSKHGHHGISIPSVRKSTVAIYGAQGDIRQGKTGFMVNQDVSSIILYALGVAQPKLYNGKIPNKVFK